MNDIPYDVPLDVPSARMPHVADATSPGLRMLRVYRKELIARDITLFELRDPGGEALPQFTAGAHVSLRTPAGLLRKYSLCSDPARRDHYGFAVKREDAGRGGSISLIDGVPEGGLVPVSLPKNDFELPPRAQDLLFVAGGIGITPFIAMIHQVRAEGKRFRLYYLSRSPDVAAFLPALRSFELRESVVIHHDYGDPGRACDLRSVLSERRNREHLYCCGPLALMRAVREMAAHWSPNSVHFEAFSQTEKAGADDRSFLVTLARSGHRFEVPVGTTILEAMRGRGLQVPSSCETGTCGTCRTKLLAGQGDHRDLFLAPDERRDNIMICVSRAVSDEVTLDR
jgi:phthalate 4,5-dioxygenase reductase component